ncbi:hypothetical protein [Brevundimonas bacteroides]|uniref:hypothetical protein n=1 Tax=Brevundimonas bacteroides TaxID=74311 RepID=UPI000496085B|nr:hypothetical protein [Brevundimonas bacteroides]
MATTYFYVDDWTDEVLPCAPTLEGWAQWLAADVRGEWNREGPIASGSEFSCSRLTDLGQIEAEKVDGVWTARGPVPEGTDSYFLRWGDSGWDADHAGDTIADALQECDDDDGQASLACVRHDPSVRVRLEISDAGPQLIVLSAIQ